MDKVAQSFWSLLLKGKNPPWGNACLWSTLETDFLLPSKSDIGIEEWIQFCSNKAFTLFCETRFLIWTQFKSDLARFFPEWRLLLWHTYFLLIMAYFSLSYTFRIIPDCYCGCIVDTVTSLFGVCSVNYSEMFVWWRQRCRSLLSWTMQICTFHCTVFLTKKWVIDCISVTFRIAGAWNNSIMFSLFL